MFSTDVIIGGLYGDEGKGKIVSNLGNNGKYDYIFRVNASTNASHTVQLEKDGEVIITKQLPSVFFNDKIKFVVAPGAILNLKALKEEIFSRPDDIMNKVFIASNITLLIEPYIDMTISSNISKQLGSTNQGTGIAVLARTRRHCIRLYDVMNVYNGFETIDSLMGKIQFSCNEIDKDFLKNKEKVEEYLRNVVTDLVNDFSTIMSKIGNFVVDYTKFLAEIPKDSRILIEGCNGIMLDNIHGLNPYTTSASTSLNALLNGANISPYTLNASYIVCSGYFCCLNKRPFVTEMNDNESAYIYKNNSEIDDAEGMKRRLGWFDLPTMRKALTGHNGCELIINKLDIMKDLKEIKVCTHYQTKDGKLLEIMPDNIKELEGVTPVYEVFEGWGDLSGIDVENIPENLEKFLKFIEENTNHKIAYIGIGRMDKDLLCLF